MTAFAFASFFILMFLSSSSSLTAVNEIDEASALLHFKKSCIEEDPNGYLLNWTNATSVCSWVGVNCLHPYNHIHSLDLSNMQLSGQLNLEYLMALPKLIEVDLHGNSFYVIDSLFSTSTSFSCNLKKLDVSDNSLSGSLDNSFFNGCHGLISLDLSRNQIYEIGIVSTICSIKYLNLSFNYMSDILPLHSLTNCTSLEVIDLSSNNFSGNIPIGFNFCKSLPSLRELLFAGNFISGKIPLEFGECLNLVKIDFSFNLLKGPIPSAVWSLPKVTDFIMWANKLEGEIPANICTRTAVLKKLILGYNDLSGTIPKSITNCRNMKWISLSGNKLTGKIPENIGNLKKLSFLQLEDNNLSGEIPPDIGNCKSLVWLGLTNNSLSGPIPSEIASQTEFTQSEMMGEDHKILSCQKSMFMFESQGIRYERVENFPLFQFCQFEIYMGHFFPSESDRAVRYIDLSYNSLSGPIPSELGSMLQLNVLRLAHNKLTGSIPESLGGMYGLKNLDLSHNHLSGSIPSELSTLSSLSHFDVSYNNLTGRIPHFPYGHPIFPSSTYENNSGLCDSPLPPCSTRPENVNDVPDSSFGPERMFIDDGSLLSGFLFGLISSASIFSIVTKLR